MPFPLLFYKYGEKIRMKCKYAAEAATILKRMQTQHEELDEDDAEEEIEAEDKRGQPSGGVLSDDETISGGRESGRESGKEGQ